MPYLTQAAITRSKSGDPAGWRGVDRIVERVTGFGEKMLVDAARYRHHQDPAQRLANVAESVRRAANDPRVVAGAQLVDLVSDLELVLAFQDVEGFVVPAHRIWGRRGTAAHLDPIL